MNLSYMGLETGHWYDGDCGWRIYVANETVCLHFEGQCCKQLLKIIKNIIFFLIFSTEYDIIFLKIRENAMNHLD